MSQMQHCIDNDVIDGDIPELNGQVLFWWGVGVSSWLAIKIDLLNPSSQMVNVVDQIISKIVKILTLGKIVFILTQ